MLLNSMNNNNFINVFWDQADSYCMTDVDLFLTVKDVLVV